MKKKPVRSAFRAGFAAFAGALMRGGHFSDFFSGESLGGKSGGNMSRPYEQSTWVYGAIGEIAKPIKGAQIEFRDKPKGGERIESPALDQFWTAPARRRHGLIDRSQFLELTIGLRGIDGNAFWILDDSWFMRSPDFKNPIILASAEMMTPFYDGGQLSAWLYRSGTGQTTKFLPEQVINLQKANPSDPDDWRGVSPLQACRVHADSEHAGANFAKAKMESNGDQGQWIVAKGSLPTPEQREQLLSAVREKRRAAERGEIKDVIIGGGDIEIQTPALQAIGSDFGLQQSADAKAIYIAFGLSASRTESASSYSIGSASDWFRDMHNAVIPEADEIAPAIALVSEYFLGIRDLGKEIATGIRERVESPHYAVFDFDDHPVMKQTREERLAIAKTLRTEGMSWEVLNTYLDLGMEPFAGWDIAYMPFSVAPVDASSGAPTDPVDEPATEEAKAKAALEQITRDIAAYDRRGKEKAEASRQAALAIVRAKTYKKNATARAKYEKRMKSGVGRLIMAARSETLDNLKGSGGNEGSNKGMVERIVIADIVFNLEKFRTGLAALVRGLGFEAITESFQTAFDEVGYDAGATAEEIAGGNPKMQKLLKERENFIKGVSDDIHAEILETLEEGVAAGETIDELTARVKTEFTGVKKERAKSIAITETGAAYEGARHEAFAKAGITKKTWLTSGDDRVRDSHRHAQVEYKDGIPFDQPFDIGGHKMQYPLDSAGPASEIINCRCILGAVAD